MSNAVSIHAPARGATLQKEYIDYILNVSIHAPARGATEARLSGFDTLEFQSTPPRGGRPEQFVPEIIPLSVSIHAPARGATRISNLYICPQRVSIHAPARGATLGNLTVHYTIGGFNPRPRAGGDTRGYG